MTRAAPVAARAGLSSPRTAASIFSMFIMYGAAMAAMVFFPRSSMPVALGMGLSALAFSALLARDLQNFKTASTLYLKDNPVLRTPGRWAVFAFLVWALVSLVWAPDPERGAKDVAALWLVLPFYAFCALELRKTGSALLMPVFSIGLLAALAMFTAQVLFWPKSVGLVVENFLFFDANRTAIAWTLLAWPLSLVLWHQGRAGPLLSIAALAVTFLAVFQSDSEAAKLGLLAAGLAFAAVFAIPRLLGVIAYAAAAVMVFAPWIFGRLGLLLDLLPQQVVKRGHLEHRISIWNGYSDLILANPLAGYGANAHRYLGYAGEAGSHAKAAGFSENIPHPHNFALEIWVNYGAIGVALAALALILTVTRLSNPHRPLAAVSAAVLSGWLGVSLVGHGMTQGWWLALTTTILIALFLADDAYCTKK